MSNHNIYLYLKVFNEKYIKFHKRKFLIINVGVVVFTTLTLFLYSTKINTNNRLQVYNEAIQSYFSNYNPSTFQVFFLDDVNKNINDVYTKSAVYFITHRYITNGGNIYELYDFFSNNQELSFTKEAENIHPEIFELIKKRKLPFNYSDQGMYAYIAYLETLEKHGYAGIEIMGALGEFYAKMAYFKEIIRKDKVNGRSSTYPNYSQKEINQDVSKAKYYLIMNEVNIEKIMNDDDYQKGLVPYSLVTGLVHFASALRYLEALDEKKPLTDISNNIFEYVISYSYHFTQELYLFTVLSNASTLLMLNTTTNRELRNAVYPLLTINPEIRKDSSVLSSVINSKLEVSNSRFEDLDIYSRKNIVTLGNRVPEFKSWLKLSGWTEYDFK